MDQREEIEKIAQSTTYSSAEVEEITCALQRFTASTAEAVEKVAVGMRAAFDAVSAAVEEQAKRGESRQRFRERGKRRW